MGLELKFSTANHLQTDGQTKWINALLNEYLRHYVLDAAQFCYNLHKSSTTDLSPAELVLGQQSLTPSKVANSKSQGECLATYRFAREK